VEDVADPQHWNDLIHAEDRPAVLATIQEALAGREGRTELRYRAKNGAEQVAFAVTQPRRQGEEVVGFIALLLDVTRERRLEQELQRAQRLELIGRLSSGIVHDFNNLIMLVVNLAELAGQGLEPCHPVQSDLHQIKEAGQHAAGLAAQLLAFSKNRKITLTRFDLNALVRRTLELMRSALPQNISAEPLLREGELVIDADETQLQQVLINLCLNARDAMPSGGRLQVQTELAHRDNRPWVRLTVRDEGHGIPEGVQGKVFDLFFTTKEKGTGLGLSVVQQIVESNGGRVEVTSTPGKGATFEVWLPFSG
jgi:signal transduction histidine kinase